MATKASQASTLSSCRRCLKAQRSLFPPLVSAHRYSSSRQDPEPDHPPASPAARNNDASAPEKGAMTRRLEEATEEALLTGGKAGRRAVEAAGFSEELKEKLLDKVQTAQFRAKYSNAISQAGLSSTSSPSSSSSPSTGAFTAASEPWAGTESQPDAVLRMLDDARKPLKPELRGKYHVPEPVDLRPRREPRIHPGQRVVNARDKAGAYTDMTKTEKERNKSNKGLTEKEREALRQQFRDRFTPAARAVPASVSALASLANERIEDAIARGQFRNIPRGKDAPQRDRRADNPFIDTTEYLMNSMLKRQEITPPWIEKQQELAKTVSVFRSRLRNDWKRHVARMIAAAGGGLEEQIRRAEGYARAEERVNPLRSSSRETAAAAETAETEADDVATGKGEQSPAPDSYAAVPFRDPDWEAAEKAYMTLSIENLNSLTRSYNLMAPELAKKPYFSLERELNACYADVAPLVAETIRERATRPARSLIKGDGTGRSKGAIFGTMGGGGKESARIYENKAPHYGFKEMWRDLWGG
ncbi:hypothetical protein ACRALDRAFT_1065216 [Sodiomyces alcalophilus JCM 7366]|uniref:uncharacterized protein n=1 Tax=Sodiomyces alcalophilus JCM 7366 TaxID=591952 RepID=UPI0039B5D87D